MLAKCFRQDSVADRDIDGATVQQACAAPHSARRQRIMALILSAFHVLEE